MKTSILVSLLILLLTNSVLASDGVSSGGGSDRPTEHGMFEDFAWFNGRQKIKTCVEVASDYGVTRDELVGYLQETFSTWRAYLDNRALNQNNQRLASELEILPSCNGDEYLSVYFGINNERTNQAKQRYNNPIGMAEVTEENSNGFSKGFIWVDKVTGPSQTITARQKNAIAGILLHEVGHAFGNQHSSGTIMDAGIASTLLDTNGPDNTRASRGIDQSRQLISCLRCRPIYTQSPASNADMIEVFNKLVGRMPVSEIRVKVYVGDEVRFDSVRITDMDGYDIIPSEAFTMEFSDRAGSFRFPLQISDLSSLPSSWSLGKVFAVNSRRPGHIGQSHNSASGATEVLASLADNRGHEYPVRVQINANSYLSVDLTLRNNGHLKSVPLFRSSNLSGLGEREKPVDTLRTCTVDSLDKYIRRNILSTLKKIHEELDATSLSITRSESTHLFNTHSYYEYQVSVADRQGKRYRLKTFEQNRHSEAFGAEVGSLFVSEPHVQEPNIIGYNSGDIPSSCEAGYLGINSLFSGQDLVYATRLVDEDGNIVNRNEDSDVFDRALRAASEELWPE